MTIYETIESRLRDHKGHWPPASSREIAAAIIDLHKRLQAIERWQELADERAMGDDA